MTSLYEQTYIEGTFDPSWNVLFDQQHVKNIIKRISGFLPNKDYKWVWEQFKSIPLSAVSVVVIHPLYDGNDINESLMNQGVINLYGNYTSILPLGHKVWKSFLLITLGFLETVKKELVFLCRDIRLVSDIEVCINGKKHFVNAPKFGISISGKEKEYQEIESNKYLLKKGRNAIKWE